VELLSGAVLPLFAPVALVGPAVLLWRVATYHLYVLAGGATLWLLSRGKQGAVLGSAREAEASGEAAETEAAGRGARSGPAAT
jgi:hypothetical protein